MKSSFSRTQQIERQALCEIIDYANSLNIQIIKTDKQIFLQKLYGDLLVKVKKDYITVEVKAEQENKYGNLFLEIWSNRKRKTPGWMATSQADYLWYYFLDTKVLYSVLFDEIKNFIKMHHIEYILKKQSKYEQLNDTWGYPVPIKTLSQLSSFEETLLHSMPIKTIKPITI